MMVIFLVTSVLVLGLLAIAIYFWQKPANKTDFIELPPPPPAGLFTDRQQEQLAETAAARLLTEKQHSQQAENDELEAKKALAEEFIQMWQESPDRNSTAKMLHLAALADDADIYRKAVEVALSAWQGGSIPDVSAAELQTLFNSEFWLLSSRARSSGAGFVLKRTLSRAKRELELANNPT
jgi:cell division protein FtsI/penicillin-binding protein 2